MTEAKGRLCAVGIILSFLMFGSISPHKGEISLHMNLTLLKVIYFTLHVKNCQKLSTKILL